MKRWKIQWEKTGMDRKILLRFLLCWSMSKSGYFFYVASLEWNRINRIKHTYTQHIFSIEIKTKGGRIKSEWFNTWKMFTYLLSISRIFQCKYEENETQIDRNDIKKKTGSNTLTEFIIDHRQTYTHTHTHVSTFTF